MCLWTQIRNPWDGRIEPFRIVGNVYFVGTYQASSHLIDTGDELTLGNTTIRFMETPGHTLGALSLFFDTQDA